MKRMTQTVLGLCVFLTMETHGDLWDGNVAGHTWTLHRLQQPCGIHSALLDSFTMTTCRDCVHFATDQMLFDPHCISNNSNTWTLRFGPDPLHPTATFARNPTGAGKTLRETLGSKEVNCTYTKSYSCTIGRHPIQHDLHIRGPPRLMHIFNVLCVDGDVHVAMFKLKIDELSGVSSSILQASDCLGCPSHDYCVYPTSDKITLPWSVPEEDPYQ